MNIIETIVLGLVQGLTEFIPVSSSGHLALLQNVLEGASDHTFIEFINIGTVLALLIYFRMRIWGIIRDVFVNKNFTLLRNIIISAIPAGLVGYLMADFIDKTPFFGSSVVIMTTLALVGVVMIILDKLPMLSHVESAEKLTPGRALVVGLVQMLSLIPGVSRSGSTIIAGRLMGFNPAVAAEYSFLVSLPIMLGVTAKVFIKASDRQYFFDHLPMLIVSNAVAFIAGMIAVGFLMRYLSKHNLAVFGWYRVGLAAVIAVVLLIQYLMTV